MKKFFIFSTIIILIISNSVFSQTDIRDNSYKFKISLNSAWKNSSKVETDKKDVIKYVYKKGNASIMIIAFKLANVQNLADFIYTIEKDAELNIPQRTSDYTEYDYDNYDGRSAVYKDANDIENIFFYRTKLMEASENYAYMIRFIYKIKEYGTTQEKEIKSIISTFTPLF
jgi:hypothetical protein